MIILFLMRLVYLEIYLCYIFCLVPIQYQLGLCWHHVTLFRIYIKRHHRQGEDYSLLIRNTYGITTGTMEIPGCIWFIGFFVYPKIVVWNLQKKLVILFTHHFRYYYMLLIIRRHILWSTLNVLPTIFVSTLHTKIYAA